MVPSFEIDDVAVTCFMPLAILITISLYESFGSHPFLAEVRVIVRPTLLLLHVKAARVRPKDSSAKSSLALNAKVDDTQNTHAAHSRLAQRVGIRETVETKKADKKPKTVRSYSRNQLYRSWGLGAHRGWARLLLDRRCLVGTSNAPRGCSNRSNYRSAHDEETAYDSYMNPEPGFRAGPWDSYDAA